VLEYALEQATNILTSEGKWQGPGQHLADLLHHATRTAPPLKAIYEIGRYRRLNKPERRRSFLADHPPPIWPIRKTEQVEMLIQQLVTMLVRKRAGRSATAAPKPAAVQPAPDKTAPTNALGKPLPTSLASTGAGAVVTFEQLEDSLKKLLMPTATRT